MVFDNRSPSLRKPEGDWAAPDMVGPETDAGTAAGKCEVICFTDNHGGSFKDLSPQRVRVLLEAWIDRVSELSQEPYIHHIAPFENRGEEIGVTLGFELVDLAVHDLIDLRLDGFEPAGAETALRHLADAGVIWRNAGGQAGIGSKAAIHHDLARGILGHVAGAGDGHPATVDTQALTL